MAIVVACLRIVVATMLICVAGYTIAVLGMARLFPDTAGGDLVVAADGTIVGSRQIAQAFTQPRYFWPRPSAAGNAGYDATASAGSNKSPTSAELTKRARALVAQYGATTERPLPAELVAASGSGLDPHISVQAANYQAARVAAARGVPTTQVGALIQQHALAPGGILAPDRLVNVLELNMALDDRWPHRKAGVMRHD